ncbi:nose resistant to fluoxetine protein 6-like [Xenia sp. Carnegie-2017]|uniref:nose resistant to fluoxetine protein 6-like n=1 Tax=Xenia sp. Carnegie-2017 TaxID=2897299 RepID=UPI001F038CD0|nr:nose resistant to fluoxetine protein 6-like [Xenia sp. Carnegie-2017]
MRFINYFFILFLISFDSLTSAAQLKGLKRNKNTTIRVLDSCQQRYEALTQEQYVRYVDASGRRESGVYGGNTLWYGSFDECNKLPDSRYCLTIFPGNMTLYQNKAETYHFEWGVCVPKSCTNNDIKEHFLYLFHNVSDISSVSPFTTYLQVQCSENPEYTTSVILTIIFCGILVGLSIFATITELLYSLKHGDHDDQNVGDRGLHISMDKETNEKTPLLPNDTKKTQKSEDSLVYKVLNSFSISRNVKWIMNTSVRKGDLTCLHGIRVLSLFWIILIHVNNLPVFFPLDNDKGFLKSQRKLAPMFLHQAYGVDTFFVLSGLLALYNNINKRVKNNGKTNWLQFYFHRFWRLTPTYMFVILLVVKFRPFCGNGPLWYLQADTSTCSKYWWKNLLYINNWKIEDLCLGPSWQLSADMQLYFISPIFLLIGYRYGLRVLFMAASVVILGSMITTFCIAATEDIYPMSSYALLRMNIFFRPIYFKTYCRVPPYAMGMILGYYLQKYRSNKIRINLKIVVFLWISTIALALTDIYAPYSSVKEDPHVWTVSESAFFWAFRWFIWGLFIVWLIFACHYGYAGWIQNILGAKFWIPLSRINYAAYLVHFEVILVLKYNVQTPIHFTWFTFVTYSLASLVLVYCIAFVITVMVELPFSNIESLGWKRLQKRT